MRLLNVVRTVWLLSFFVTLTVCSSVAQQKQVINYLGIENGLSNSAVRSIFQDHNGFMWFGTYDGLNRYDGYEFKIFRNRSGDTSTLVHNWVNCIAEDAQYRLWVGTQQGLSIYNPASGRFIAAKYKVNNTVVPVRGNIKEIKADLSGNVFVSVEQKGLILYKHDSKSIGRLINTPLASHYNISSLAIDTNHDLWLIIENIGLCIYDKKLQKIKLVDARIHSAYCMLFDAQTLWIANSAGLSSYKVAAKTTQNHYTVITGQLTSQRFTSMIKGGTNELWVATDGGGVNILNTTTGKFSYLTNGNGSHYLTSNAVAALYCDKESRKWVGTLRGGINILDPHIANFKNISYNSSSSNSLVNNFVLSLLEESPQRLWIGTDGGGLSIWDRPANQFTNFTHRAGDNASLPGNFITSIKKDAKGNIWVASYDGGIGRYANGRFIKYEGINPANNRTSYTFWLLETDKQGRLWAGSIQNGLYVFNTAANRFELYEEKLNNLLVLKADKSGQYWGGDWWNLIRIDLDHKKYERFGMDKPVRSVFEDSMGDFWVGTEAGLILFDRKNKRIIKKYTTDDGLGNNHVLNIEEDKAGNLWISTYNGLSCFNIKTRKFNTYSQANGLPSNEFNFNASLALHSGELAFGSIKGLCIFNPQNISQTRSDPNIVLSGLKVNNQPIAQSPQFITKRTNNEATELKVPYDKAVFTFDFTAIDYPYAERINYRYKMEGWDRGWINAGNVRSATYTNLAPGNYTFKINCTNRDGSWVKKQVAIHLIVLPPWYLSWWAYVAYVLIFATLVYIFVSYRVKQTRLKYEVKLAVADAKKQKIIQEKEREINEKRLEFFTSISHEFRTPISLIINPIRDMLRLNTDDKGLNTVHRNARRLLSLVDQLLLFRKADSGTVQLRVSPVNIYRLCNEVYLCFKQQAKSAGLEYEFLAQEDKELMIYADSEKLEIILFNLISNAIKFTPPAGKVTIAITETTAGVEIAVTDTGCGIPQQEGERLFEKYYQSRSEGRPVKAGFGIGLYLARQFADEHQGSLTYNSELNKGTTFTLALLNGKEHFAPDIIVSTHQPEALFINELVTDDHVLTAEVQPEEEFKAENIFTDRKAILTIDDDAEIRSYIRSVFSPQYIVYEAASGEEAMDMVKDKLPDLVLCDVMMSGMTGIEWCDWLRQDVSLSYIPVILLTASSSSENKLKGLDCGADDYISKPFEKELLLARVANLLNTRNNLRSYFYNEVTLQSNNVAISEEYKDFLQKCITIVEKHITNPNFSIKVLASEIGMSHSNLYRKVKSMSGYTINGFIRLIRLRKAAELLINTEYNINEVAFETGFNNAKYFRMQFVKLFEMTPSDFAKRNRKVFKKRVKVNL
ncbi:hybrid sensor histidine kinase/response regulator [Mucilaginibacter terrae]|uniref:histidine kinase n=1 Tax=Mucilaginibacter terrae TaxID=1955052 RepID=A0ABU3GQJ4_9SPHI|nr:two-component regulator propeller domain-containing protein [Mucilaginibacter terrae]MDT3402053.1 signal transduction histidine kinase/ligand-binding sensor domain-containing protein/DNA-binding response OmpR family regulator [Mucilaginibacter terrae]